MYKIEIQNEYNETFTTNNFCRVCKYIREILEKDFRIFSTFQGNTIFKISQI